MTLSILPPIVLLLCRILDFLESIERSELDKKLIGIHKRVKIHFLSISATISMIPVLYFLQLIGS